MQYRHELLALTVYRRPNEDFDSYAAMVTLYNKNAVKDCLKAGAIRIIGVNNQNCRIIPYSRMQHCGTHVVDLYVAELLPLKRVLKTEDGQRNRVDIITTTAKSAHDNQAKRAYDNWFQHENEVAQNMAYMSAYEQTNYLFRALDNDNFGALSLVSIQESINQERLERASVLNQHLTVPGDLFLFEHSGYKMPDKTDPQWKRLSIDKLASAVQVRFPPLDQLKSCTVICNVLN